MLHVSADTDKVMASRISIAGENSNDITQFPRFMNNHEVKVYADKAYYSKEYSIFSLNLGNRNGSMSMNM